VQLPCCKQCNGLHGSHVAWFGVCHEDEIVECAHNAWTGGELLLVIGISAVVQVLQSVLN
jgi:NAD-dependent SIR2 family protein deacetylase